MKLPVKYSTLPAKDKRKVREAYILKQKGLCYYCNGTLKTDPGKDVLSKPINWKLFPTGFLNYPVHLHHCHTTDNTLGAVHAYCNAVLRQYHKE